MKKISVFIIAFMAILVANAQVYVGGTAGFTSTSNDGTTSTSFKIMPEIGYSINNKWSVGGVIGYQKGNVSLISTSDADAKLFLINPYARYTFFRSSLVNVFVDGGVGYGSLKANSENHNYYQIGITPGICLNLSKNLCMVGKFGYLGYQKIEEVKQFGLGLDGNSISLGLYYSF